MNYELLTLIVAFIVGIGSISTSVIVGLNGVKKSQLDALNTWVKNLEEENGKLQTRVVDLENANEKLKQERENSRQTREEAENRLYRSLQEKINFLIEMSDKLRNENIELRKTTEKLQKDLDLSIGHRKERDEKILVLQKQIEEMQKTLADRDCQIGIMADQISNLQSKQQ